MPRPEELRLTEYGSEDSDYDEDIFNNSIIHSYEKKVRFWNTIGFQKERNFSAKLTFFLRSIDNLCIDSKL